MKYRVRWKRSALDELTKIWTNAASEDRGAITSAVHRLETDLAVLGQNAGESRSGAERIIFQAPIAMLFEAVEQGEVFVLQIWRY